MGSALAMAVLIDAFVVRMTIVPAVLFLLGDRAWKLPRWLDKIIPSVDVEGEGLVGLEAPEHDTAGKHEKEPATVGADTPDGTHGEHAADTDPSDDSTTTDGR